MEILFWGLWYSVIHNRLQIKNTLQVLQDILYKVKIQKRKLFSQVWFVYSLKDFLSHSHCFYFFPGIPVAKRDKIELFSECYVKVPTDNLQEK